MELWPLFKKEEPLHYEKAYGWRYSVLQISISSSYGEKSHSEKEQG